MGVSDMLAFGYWEGNRGLVIIRVSGLLCIGRARKRWIAFNKWPLLLRAITGRVTICKWLSYCM